jgi:DNA-directed RNA polymerase specialized sigma24 family protein
MSRLPDTSQIEEFEHLLARYYREDCNLLIRRFSSMGEAGEIRGAIHEVLAGIFERYIHGEPSPENLGGFVHVAVRRKLIDRIREEVGKIHIQSEDLDRVLVSGLPTRPTTSEEAIEGEDMDSAPASGLLNLPVNPEDATAWKELFHTVFDRLPPKWHEVAKMAMQGASPAEIGKSFDQNGYVLRRHARELICRILGELADAGDGLARGLAHDFCRRSRQAAQPSRSRGR